MGVQQGHSRQRKQPRPGSVKEIWAYLGNFKMDHVTGPTNVSDKGRTRMRIENVELSTVQTLEDNPDWIRWGCWE